VFFFGDSYFGVYELFFYCVSYEFGEDLYHLGSLYIFGMLSVMCLSASSSCVMLLGSLRSIIVWLLSVECCCG